MINAYLENMVLTANPIRQVILLYEKAIACLEEAIECMNSPEEDIETLKRKYSAMGRAVEILTVLDASLNMEQGGDIAKNLHEVYQALSDDLVRITLQGDEPQTLSKMVKILRDLKESWEEVERQVYGKPQAITT
ncbi:MAG: flagellar protein FliS [Aquificota bacterium]|nr:MAG: flagellar protein FliS [Aquificota bacterium]